MKIYSVSGIFILEIEADSTRDAEETAKRILSGSGIYGKIVQTEEVKQSLDREWSCE